MPHPLPRGLVLAARDDEIAVFVNVKVRHDQDWAYAASDAVVAARWIEVARWLEEHPDGDVTARFGRGLLRGNDPGTAP